MGGKWIPFEEAMRAHYPFQAIVAEDGTWHITFPDLPGCATDADTWDEIVPMMREVLDLWLTSEAERGHPIPAPTMGRPAGYEPWRGSLTLSPEELALVRPPNGATPVPDTAPTLGTREVADRLGVNPSRVRALAHSRGVGRRIGKSLAFSEADVAQLAHRRPGRPRRAS